MLWWQGALNIISKGEVVYFLYGYFGEYSLKQFEILFRNTNVPYYVIANMTSDEIQRLVRGINGRKILITSAHPYIPLKAQSQRNCVAHSLSIAALRRLEKWFKIIYVSHDILEEYKFTERFYANEYDLFCLHYPERYTSVTKNIPVVKLPLPTYLVEYEFSSLAVFFISEWDYYRFSLSPEEFLQKFPFLLHAKIALKPPLVPGDDQFRKDLQSLGVKLITPTIRAEEILPFFKGLVITNASSGVVKLGHYFGSKMIVLNDFSTKRIAPDLKKTLTEVSPPFSREIVDSFLSQKRFQKNREIHGQELNFPLQETFRLMKISLGI